MRQEGQYKGPTNSLYPKHNGWKRYAHPQHNLPPGNLHTLQLSGGPRGRAVTAFLLVVASPFFFLPGLRFYTPLFVFSFGSVIPPITSGRVLLDGGAGGSLVGLNPSHSRVASTWHLHGLATLVSQSANRFWARGTCRKKILSLPRCDLRSLIL